MSPRSPITPVIQHRTRVSLDPSYRGGYESDETSPLDRSEPVTSPIYRPPKSPGSPRVNQPPRPRISTNFDTVTPLNIQRIPEPKALNIHHTLKPKEVHWADEGITSADVQCGELTNILDLYLDEIVTDAASRGVISAGLEEYLKSPTIMGEWDKMDIVDDVGIAGVKENGKGFVSIIRQALMHR